MFLRGDFLSFAFEGREGADHAEARVARFDDVLDVALLRSLVGVAEEVVVFLLAGLGDLRLLDGIRLGLELLAVEDAHGALGAHDGDVGRRPGVVDVAAELLAAHHEPRHRRRGAWRRW